MTHEEFQLRLAALLDEAADAHDVDGCGSHLCSHFIVHDLISEIARLAEDQDRDIKLSVVDAVFKHLFPHGQIETCSIPLGN